MKHPASFLRFVFLSSFVLLVSCNRVADCQNGGTLDSENNCQCPEGYVGVSCESELREIYLGNFNGTVTSLYADSLVQNPYTAILERNTDDATRVNISINKAPFNTPFIGIVNSFNVLYIPMQTVNGKALSGSAVETEAGIRMDMNYDGYDFSASFHR